jgi:riboflavin-specific deaminase-like protein
MKRPFILVNFAISADGKIGSPQKTEAAKFTSQGDLDRLLSIRQRADAILVGRGTLEADDMSMTIPADRSPTKQPLRCIISRKGEFDSGHKVFQSEGGDLHLVVTKGKEKTDELPARWHFCSLAEFLTIASQELGVDTLLCEGGGELARELFELGVIDEVNITIAAHSLLGGKESPTISGILGEHLPTSERFVLLNHEITEDNEIFLTYQKSSSPT